MLDKTISNITKSKYSSINSIIEDLNSLRAKIDRLEEIYRSLLGDNMLSLDIKVLLEQDFSKKQKLNEVYNKQKSILLSLNGIFTKLVRRYVMKGNK